MSAARQYHEDDLPSEGGAIALAWLGLLCGPLSLVGMLWGAYLMHKTNSRRGVHAFVVGLLMTILWAVTVVVLEVYTLPMLGL